ncbi:hypothetical protein L596_000198 [Steinernema carpocapsae]|uniref:Uncharacterized protein n=1 Tax=Steinernema carpocapsae TaxID=34508 RepID=A0A4U8UI05_STECR|nr:hypothetical protein L596_000198 [Steinernema carpocapsae]
MAKHSAEILREKALFYNVCSYVVKMDMATFSFSNSQPTSWTDGKFQKLLKLLALFLSASVLVFLVCMMKKSSSV